MNRPHEIEFRKPVVKDAELLSMLAEDTFRKAYDSEIHAGDLETYIHDNFYVARQLQEISDPKADILITFIQDQPVGYSMIRLNPLPACVDANSAVELKRFYLLPEAKGTGVADSQMQATLANAKQKNHKAIWLGCWENNARAIAFYKRWKFIPVGHQNFLVGSDLQRDIVFLRKLSQRPPVKRVA